MGFDPYAEVMPAMRATGDGGTEGRGRPDRRRLVATAMLLAVATVFFLLHYVHLRADFPNHSPWMDWAKYTDEGWYGDAAIRFFERGSWYVKGDFNPAAALPTWPLLEAAVFRVTGVGIVPARALVVTVFGLILLCSYALLRRWQERRGPALAAAAGVLLLAVSPFCYAFMRMAVLEPLLILLMLLSLLAATEVRPGATGWRGWWPALVLGVLLPAMVLTKTTAVFLLPAVGWMVWARSGYRVRGFARTAGVSGGLALLLWAGYYGLVVRPEFLEDYRYLFSANAYTGITLANARQVLVDTVSDGDWIGHGMYVLACVAVVTALVGVRRFGKRPLVVSLVLWALGYAAFLAYHNNLQPRYYLVVAVPLTLLVPVVLEVVWERSRGALLPRAAVALGSGVLLVIALSSAWQTLGYVRRPEYTFEQAAEGVRRVVEADKDHSRLVLSISGSDLSLMTGLPSICDDFGTLDLTDRVAAYKPGWYVAWNQVDDDKMDALTPFYRVERVAAFPAMDDPERNLLIVYRLDPAEGGARRKRRRKPVPKLLETKLGQQPSETQLEH